MAKGMGVRQAATDGLCDLIESFWGERELVVAQAATVLRLRGVRHPDDLDALDGDTTLEAAVCDLMQSAALGGAATESLITLYRAARRDVLAGARLHELLRTLPDEWAKGLEASPFLSERYEMADHVRWWGRVRGAIERWAAKPGAALTPSQQKHLEVGVAALGHPNTHLHLWTDGNGTPQVEYWIDAGMGERARASSPMMQAAG